MVEERAYWLAWSRIPGIGATLLLRLQHHFGALAIAWSATVSELEAVEGLGRQTAELAVRERSRLNPAALLEDHERENPCFWTPADPGYPRLLLEIPDPPPVLYYWGDVDESENEGILPSVAIVGTRYPSDYGKRWTRKISSSLAQAGFTIVSGLAQGVDTVAHHSCLNAGGRTIAVLGTGVDIVYPHTNRSLAEQIRQRGLLVSEYPSGTQPDRTHFPRRNRIIAGLSRATLVLEAPQKSGALITARLANDYNRDVYALPGSLDNPRSKGCLELINTGAQMILGENQLLELLGAMPRLQVVKPIDEQLSFLKANLDPILEQVFNAIPSEPISFDRIVQQTELATGIVSGALAQLELLGLVALLPGMQYQRV